MERRRNSVGYLAQEVDIGRDKNRVSFLAEEVDTMVVVVVVVVVAFSSRERILGECSTIHSPPAR